MSKIKRLTIVILSILMLLPSVISYGALVCPYCGGGPTTCKCPKMKCEKCGGEFNTTLYTGHVASCIGSSDEESDEESENVLDSAEEIADYINSNIMTDQGYWSDDQRIAQAENVALIIVALKTDGYTNEAIAGVLANIQHESRFDPYCTEGKYNYFECYNSGQDTWTGYTGSDGSGGIGLCQWTFGRHVNFSNWCKDTNDYVTVTSTYKKVDKNSPMSQDVSYVSPASKQIAYLIYENSWSKSNAKSTVNGVTIDLPEIQDLTEYKNLTDASNAAKYWCLCWEIPGDRCNRANSRAESADEWLTLVGSNSNFGGAVNESAASDFAVTMVGTQLWDEEQLSSFCKLSELNLESILKEADRQYLTQDQLDSLSDWENNIAMDKEEDGWISLLRKCVMLVGILFTVWMLLIYISYWFDRLNNFIDLDLLGILSFGFLHISDTEEECTFHINDLGTEKSNGRTVNHRAILTIILIGIGFGVLLISGVFYIAVAGLVNTVRDWLN